MEIFFLMEEVCVIFSGWKRFSRKLLKACGEGLSGSCAKELDNKSTSQCLYITHVHMAKLTLQKGQS